MENVFIQLFQQSGLVAQGIILLLFVLSVLAWSIIPAKIILLKRSIKLSEDFIQYFRTLHDPLSIPVDEGIANPACPLYDIYKDAKQFIENVHGRDGISKQTLLDETLNRMQRKIASINIMLNEQMITLASATGVGPLLGLLGTVWGIMTTFRDIGTYGASNITIVAPGMAESLVTTVAGLLVAIPSLIGYNYLQSKITQLNELMKMFSSELLSSLEIYSAR